SHLVLFGFIYPSERTRIPSSLMRRCLELLQHEMHQPSPRRVCRGPITSRAQYLADVQLWGYEDARLLPYGSMTEQDAAIGTAAIEEELSRPVGADALGEMAGYRCSMRASPATTTPAPPSDPPMKRRRPLWPFIGFGIFVLGMVILGRFVDLNRHIQIA